MGRAYERTEQLKMYQVKINFIYNILVYTSNNKQYSTKIQNRRKGRVMIDKNGEKKYGLGGVR